jgi:ATP-dependent helicase HepA
MGDAIDLLLESPAGTAACASLPGDAPGLLLEVLFVLETVADARWHVDEFLPPAPVRVVVDLRGRDRTAEHPAAAVAAEAVDRALRPLLERPGFNGDLRRARLEAAEARADAAAASVRAAAAARADAVLAEGVARLESLRRINDTVRPAEIELAAEQRQRIGEAIGQARLRLDAVRLLVVGDPADE